MTDILVAVICTILTFLFIIVVYEWKLIIRKRKLDIWRVELELLESMAVFVSDSAPKSMITEDLNTRFAKEMAMYIQAAKFTLPKQVINQYLNKYFR